MQDDYDVQGQINALMVAISAAIAILPQERRDAFHGKMRQLAPSPVSRGYMEVAGRIIANTR